MLYALLYHLWGLFMFTIMYFSSLMTSLRYLPTLYEGCINFTKVFKTYLVSSSTSFRFTPQ